MRVVERFDRVGERRIGYVSALTMLERADGEGGSYLEIADVIQRHSPNAAGDLRELWRRIAFSILISNFDDHLRNHGFLRTSSAGWSLSPAFDVNPDPRPGERHLNTAIDFDDSAARLPPSSTRSRWQRSVCPDTVGRSVESAYLQARHACLDNQTTVCLNLFTIQRRRCLRFQERDTGT